MMVIFTSRSEKKSLAATRRILDSFANRIGNDTWKTIITEAGLAMVKTLLRRNATKSTAVACHWIRSRNRSDLLWIVGNKDKFNSEGIVPVNTTSKDLRHGDWENTWEYLPLLKAVTALAGLLHDWGKASDHFQAKLKKRAKTADPLRHEWISCCLIAALVSQTKNSDTDEAWLSMLAEGRWEERSLIEDTAAGTELKLECLPPVAQMICWLILSHHRLPLREEKVGKYFGNAEKETFQSMLSSIHADWGYSRPEEPADNCRKFSLGLLKDSEPWMKQLKKWSAKLLNELSRRNEIERHERIRPFLNYCRLALMLGDHYASSQGKKDLPAGNKALFANTDKKGELKQQLDEHLLFVTEQALKIAHHLPRFAEKMDTAVDVPALRHRSPAAFAWQDDVVGTVKAHRKAQAMDDSDRHGWFIVNLAGTGCGKTFANAKIMRAISPDGASLRYILALGLRSLTLQTGDEYRKRIKLDADKMAVIIGSTAVSELHRKAVEDADDEDEDLLGADLADYEGYTDEFMDIFFDKSLGEISKKNAAFLYRPVLVNTIDHMMGATETKRGGRYILPLLRLMSSDLVIDEIDDFSPEDLMAISRLVHLAGMFGRSVAISSATIPPDLAKGLFKAYRAGWNCYAEFMTASSKLSVLWCDEFSARAEIIAEREIEAAGLAFAAEHQAFVEKRIKKLRTKAARRKGKVIDCTEAFDGDNESKELKYYQKISDTVYELHDNHHIEDKKTGKKISFGIVRMANIDPCVAVGKYLAGKEWSSDYTVKVMVYHSRQVLLMRHEQERYLDSILKRPGENSAADIVDPVLRRHIDGTAADNVIFVVVATPVEEVGRDHDFDWAIVEPSSYRSIIQLAGRVLRHRSAPDNIETPNIAVLQYNMRGLRGENRAYIKPGFETKSLSLRSHDFNQIADVKALENCIDAVPRINKAPDVANDSLIGIEHLTMERFQDTEISGPQSMRGWLKEYWWMTAFPQYINKFRNGRQEIKLCRVYKDGTFIFSERDNHGKWIDDDRASFHGIEADTKSEVGCNWWLDRDYMKALEQNLTNSEPDEEMRDKELKRISLRYGEISIPENSTGKYYYSDQLGLYKKKGERR